ncbi:MAG TPA: hypothetical protein VD865_02960 [Stenotrophomonas sp.]|nr:hypothetical protein [Stenotrophomonas sp.]
MQTAFPQWRHQMNTSPRLAAFCLCVGTGLAAPSAWAQRSPGLATEMISVTRTVTYPPNSVEGPQALDWIRSRSPTYAPRLRGGQVNVTRSMRTTAAIDSLQMRGASAAMSPVPVPGPGLDGERYGVVHSLPDGSRESWIFEWRGGGGWSVVEYDYRL